MADHPGLLLALVYRCSSQARQNSGTPQGQLAPAQAGSRPPEINLAEHRIRRKQILGGLIHEYQVAA